MHQNDALQYFSAVYKYLVYLFYARVYFQATQCIKYSNITRFPGVEISRKFPHQETR